MTDDTDEYKGRDLPYIIDEGIQDAVLELFGQGFVPQGKTNAVLKLLIDQLKKPVFDLIKEISDKEEDAHLH